MTEHDVAELKLWGTAIIFCGIWALVCCTVLDMERDHYSEFAIAQVQP